jgi:hypothetical protein
MSFPCPLWRKARPANDVPRICPGISTSPGATCTGLGFSCRESARRYRRYIGDTTRATMLPAQASSYSESTARSRDGPLPFQDERPFPPDRLIPDRPPGRASCRPGLVTSDAGVWWYGSTTSICLLTPEGISSALAMPQRCQGPGSIQTAIRNGYAAIVETDESGGVWCGSGQRQDERDDFGDAAHRTELHERRSRLAMSGA